MRATLMFWVQIFNLTEVYIQNVLHNNKKFESIVAVTSISKVSLVGILATFAAIITPSPLFSALTSITGNKYYVILVFLAGALMYKNIIKSNFVLFCAITIICFQLLATIYWEELKLIILPFYFLY